MITATYERLPTGRRRLDWRSSLPQARRRLRTKERIEQRRSRVACAPGAIVDVARRMTLEPADADQRADPRAPDSAQRRRR